jgi:uncharacterized surface protein with fasciclin (FAS1) repeats
MKNTNKTLLAILALTALALPVASFAHCGSCGTEDKHAHAEGVAATETMEATTMAIFPLAEEAGFTTLVAAVKAAGLDETLTEGGPFTVFAPTDEAFAKLPKGTVENLLANPEQLKKVLLYHVVSGSVASSEVVKMDSAMTLEGTTVAINAKDGVKINDATVIKADIEASNGTVHVIDTVLIPENL